MVIHYNVACLLSYAYLYCCWQIASPKSGSPLWALCKLVAYDLIICRICTAEVFNVRVEFYINDPEKEPDPEKWKTDIVCLLDDEITVTKIDQ